MATGFEGRPVAERGLCARPPPAQAWWLDVAAENVASWIEVYLGRREALRRRETVRLSSVSLDYLIGATLDCKPAEIADRLVEARVLPERENEDGELLVQWKQLLRRARKRYRRREGP